MKTLGQLLIHATDFLKEKKIENPRRTVEELLAHTLGMKRLDLYMQHDRPLSENEIAPFRELIAKKIKGVPTDYLLGYVDFAGVRIHISQDVLVPRPETELLLEKATEGAVCFDICTGSGCLAIGYKKRFAKSRVIASDICEKALSVARKNSDEVEFRQGDLLEPFAGEKADVVLCNPPYLREDEPLPADPRVALVAGPTGLEFYERLAKELPSYLNPDAKVFLEIGAKQGQAVKNLFSHFKKVTCEADYAGHDRFVCLEN